MAMKSLKWLGIQSRNGREGLVRTCVFWTHSFGSVTDTELGSSVEDHALRRRREAWLQTLNPVRFVDLKQAVTESFGFSFSVSFTHVSC